MTKFNRDHEDDATILRRVPAAVAQERENRALVLEHLAEITRRGLEMPRDLALQMRGVLEDMIDEL